MMDSCSFTVHGLPMGKGSLSRMPNGAMLPAGTAASRIRVASWRDDVRAEALRAMGDRGPFLGAIRLGVDFTLPYPASLIRKYQQGWWPHIKTPDVDKLLRALLDHLTGIVWRDDSQVCYVMLSKAYAWDHRPGAQVVADALGEDELREIARGRALLANLCEGLS